MSDRPLTQTILTTERAHADESLLGLLPQLNSISKATGISPFAIAREYLRIVGGPGGVSPAEFLELRLFDTEMYKGKDVREFVGETRNAEFCYAINYRHDLYWMLDDKIAATNHLNAHGLPVIPVKALYALGSDKKDVFVLHDRASLEALLQNPENYPLFGKPTDSLNSLGSVGLIALGAKAGTAITSDGRMIGIIALVAEIETHYSGGYLFQSLVSPESSIAALCGRDRLPTVRFVTTMTGHGAELFRVAWKMPAGKNTADNFWREGNLLLTMDIEGGKVLRAVSGRGLTMQEHQTHPDTEAQLVGFAHPHWNEMKALALEGARLMRDIPYIGWDIACTDEGPVIVEMNKRPDAFLMQFAERRGILDGKFKRLIEYQRHQKDLFEAEIEGRPSI